jgi:hypothetical protein
MVLMGQKFELTAEQVDDIDTMLQYLLHDGKEREDFLDYMLDTEQITEEQYELLNDGLHTQPDSKEVAKLLDELANRRSTAHVWPAARRLEMDIRKMMHRIKNPRQIYQVDITVRALKPEAELHRADQEDNPAGKHYVAIEADSEEQAVKGALDVFHNEVPIKMLEDFEITTKCKEIKKP